MKKLLVAGIAAAALCGAPALAADAPVKMPVKAVAAQHNWTGWYAGVNYGTGISQMSGNTPGGAVGSIDRADTGYSVGVQGGYNWQYHPNWVAGIEGDINWLGIDRKFEDWNDTPVAFGVKTDWYGTIRGRLGYTSSPSLFYVTGGAAFVDVTNHFVAIAAGPAAVVTPSSNSKVVSGWTAGWGIETMLGGNWSAKAEYLYIDAGSQDVFNPSRGETARFDQRFHVFRQGLNYRFGGPGAPASALPAHNWIGFYAGVNAGAGLSQVHARSLTVFDGAVDIADSAFTGGVQAGYNWHFSPQWVAGVEGDIGYLGIDRTFRDWNENIAFGVKTDWYGTVRARLGRSTGPALLYVTGGAAFVKVRNQYNNIITTSASNSEVATGWTYGGGIEAALGNNWTAKSEYLLIDAGEQNVFNANIGGTTTKFDNRFHVFKFGLNYKFGDIGKGPVYAKY